MPTARASWTEAVGMALANGEVELAPGGNATLVGLTSENYGMESSLLRERRKCTQSGCRGCEGGRRIKFSNA